MILVKNEQMMKLLKDWEIDKHNLARMKQKNILLKMEVKACHNKERLVIWVTPLFVVIVAAEDVVCGGRRM